MNVRTLLHSRDYSIAENRLFLYCVMKLAIEKKAMYTYGDIERNPTVVGFCWMLEYFTGKPIDDSLDFQRVAPEIFAKRPPAAGISGCAMWFSRGDWTPRLQILNRAIETICATGTTIVRGNLIRDVNYAPYCGNNKAASSDGGCNNPRDVFNNQINQFVCPKCGSASEFPEYIITLYKAINYLYQNPERLLLLHN